MHIVVFCTPHAEHKGSKQAKSLTSSYSAQPDTSESCKSSRMCSHNAPHQDQDDSQPSAAAGLARVDPGTIIKQVSAPLGMCAKQMMTAPRLLCQAAWLFNAKPSADAASPIIVQAICSHQPHRHMLGMCCAALVMLQVQKEQVVWSHGPLSLPNLVSVSITRLQVSQVATRPCVCVACLSMEGS